jgi:hypothetical protein
MNLLVKFHNMAMYKKSSLLALLTNRGIPMSFKSFSTAHNTPAKEKPADDSKLRPLVDHPPAPAAKAPAEVKPANKP